jgi:hypothetical protein
VLGWAFAGILFWCNALGLGELIQQSADRWVIAAMVLVSVGGTFGVCFTATRLELLGSGGLGEPSDPEPSLEAVKVRARGEPPRSGAHTKN